METMCENLTLPLADGTADAILARPTSGRHPVVLLISDVFGLRPRIAEMATRIASWGYVVLAPNLAHRSRGIPLLPDMDLTTPDSMSSAMAEVFPLFKALTPEHLVGDASAALAWLDDQPFVTAGPVGVTGYCFGGRLGIQLAEALPERIAAAGAFHTAGLVTDEPDSPHRGVGTIRAELLLRPADNDPGADPAMQATLAQALDAAGVRYSQSVYPDAPHGYTMADTWRFQDAACERHFVDLRDLLDRTLRG